MADSAYGGFSLSTENPEVAKMMAAVRLTEIALAKLAPSNGDQAIDFTVKAYEALYDSVVKKYNAT